MGVCDSGCRRRAEHQSVRRAQCRGSQELDRQPARGLRENSSAARDRAARPQRADRPPHPLVRRILTGGHRAHRARRHQTRRLCRVPLVPACERRPPERHHRNPPCDQVEDARRVDLRRRAALPALDRPVSQGRPDHAAGVSDYRGRSDADRDPGRRPWATTKLWRHTAGGPCAYTSRATTRRMCWFSCSTRLFNNSRRIVELRRV